MLKILKWAYDLGVRQERVRIASHLQFESQKAYMSREAKYGMLRESGDKMSKTHKQKLDFSLAVDTRINEIINEMFTSRNDQWIQGASLMFPDEKENK